MAPEGRLSILDSLQEAIIDASDRHLEVVGRAPEAVSTPSAGDGAEDVPELPQAIPPALTLLRESRRSGWLACS
jgi:hypothetical protein